MTALGLYLARNPHAPIRHLSPIKLAYQTFNHGTFGLPTACCHQETSLQYQRAVQYIPDPLNVALIPVVSLAGQGWVFPAAPVPARER